MLGAERGTQLRLAARRNSSLERLPTEELHTEKLHISYTKKKLQRVRAESERESECRKERWF